jgi:DNA-binding transcriptional MerR regulator
MSRKRNLKALQCAEYVTIGELAELSGIRYSTLKYYTESGLIPYQQHGAGTVRKFHRITALQRLMEIQNWKKEKRMTIQEIREKLLEEQSDKNKIDN